MLVFISASYEASSPAIPRANVCKDCDSGQLGLQEQYQLVPLVSAAWQSSGCYIRLEGQQFGGQ